MSTNTMARIAKMKKLSEIQNTMFKRQEGSGGARSYPMRLLKEDIEKRRTPKERERGWINDYKGGVKVKSSFGYLDEQLVLSRKILGREPHNIQSYLASLNKYKKGSLVEMHDGERGWTSKKYKDHAKEPKLNESLYGMSKPTLHGHEHGQHDRPVNTVNGNFLERKTVENAKKLQTGQVYFGREQPGKGRVGLKRKLAKSRGVLSSEQQSLPKAKITKKWDIDSVTGDITKRSTVSHEQKSPCIYKIMGGQQNQTQRYHTRLVVPIGTLERSGFGNASYRASITPEGQRDKYNQLVETGWVNRYDAARGHFSESKSSKERSDADILKEGIEREEEEGWMSSYTRKQTRELYMLAKQRDKTASQILKESHNSYREGGWINPLQRQKPGVYVLGTRRTAAEMTESI